MRHDRTLPADVHGHAKGEHRAYAQERAIAYTPRMLFLWFYHACKRGAPRYVMVSDHTNFLHESDPAAVQTLRTALELASAGEIHAAAELTGAQPGQVETVAQALRRGAHFSIGAEVDDDPRAPLDAAQILEEMAPDGIIASVHFLTIDHPVTGEPYAWPFDNPEFADLHQVVGAEQTWERYIDKLLTELQAKRPQIAGHFFVPAKFGHWPDERRLREYETRFVETCARTKTAIELNTRLLYRDTPASQKQAYLDANRRLLSAAKAAEVPIAAGSDAHSPADQGRAFDIALELLASCEITHVVFPIAGILHPIPLDSAHRGLL